MSDKPSSSSRVPKLLLFALAVFGPPSAAILAFTHAVTQNPWVATFLIVLYEIAVFFAGILSEIWQQLKPSWIKQIAESIDRYIRIKFSGYEGHYCQWLIYQHRDFDVKGLSTQGIYTLDLEQVFVDLSIDPTPPHQTSSDPIRLPPALASGEHTAWDYLEAEALETQQLVIIGAPGSGKTSLLKHITLTLVTWQKHHRHVKNPHTLPFLLFLRESVRLVQDTPDCSLADVVYTYLQRGKCPAPAGWVERQLAKGRCLLLLDGLDEVADPVQRQQITEWVQQQMKTYGNNRFLLTSRPFGYLSNPLSGVTVLEVHPFTAKQIKRFIHNWYLANERMSSKRNDPGVQMKAEEGAQDLLRRLWKAPALFDLAVNPLLLTMISTVHRYRSSLPGKRVDLYEEICEVFLGKRQEALGITLEINARQKLQVLQPLAYQMMQKGVREIPSGEACQLIKAPLEAVSPQIFPQRFLQLVEQTSGLLLEREQGIYSFAHLTFQEYLAATYIKEAGLEDDLTRQVGTSWWHETILLYCAQADATLLIAVCLAGDRPSVPALLLALECQQEAPKIQPGVRAKLDSLLDQGIEDPDPERRQLIAEVLLERRVRQMVPLSEAVYRDTSLVTCAEYQLFLDDQGARGIGRRPDHWETDIHLPIIGRKPVLGVRPSDAVAFCQWLTERDLGTWHYRLPYEGECEMKGEDKKTKKTSTDEQGYWTDGGKGFSWLKRPTDSANNAIYALFSSDSISTNVYVLVSLLENAQAQASDLARYLVLISNLALNIARASNIARAREVASDLSLNLVLISNPTTVRDHPSDLTYAIARDLARANYVARELALDLDLARNIAIDLARVRNIDIVSNINSDIDSISNIDSLNSGVREHASISGLDLDHISTLIHKFASHNNLARDFASTFKRDDSDQLTEGEEDASKTKMKKEQSEFLHFHFRLATLILVHFLFQQSDKFRPSRPWSAWLVDSKSMRSEEENIKQAIEYFLDFYRDLVILELRMQGKLPAWEGILLIKEQQQDT